MGKYYIVPQENQAYELNAVNSNDAMASFAAAMESDMNTYFKALNEKEYKRYVEDAEYKGAEKLYKALIDICYDDHRVTRGAFDGILSCSSIIGNFKPKEIIQRAEKMRQQQHLVKD